jgi:hypothetical protein
MTSSSAGSYGCFRLDPPLEIPRAGRPREAPPLKGGSAVSDVTESPPSSGAIPKRPCRPVDTQVVGRYTV